MAEKALYQTSNYVFAGNPILLNLYKYQTNNIAGGKFTVTYQRRKVYEGRFNPPATIDLSDIASAVCTRFQEPDTDRSVLQVVEPFDYLFSGPNSNQKMRVDVDYNGRDTEEFEMIALPGGIPAQQFKVYAESGSDVFTSRLVNTGANIFFTTRTAGWRIEVKETELFPLCFISAAGNTYLRVTDVARGNEIGYTASGSGLYALDLDMLRKDFLAKTGSLASMFDISLIINGSTTYACQIVITHCNPSKERYRLKFLNSFKVFEIFELTGKMTDSTEFGDTEDSYYRQLDMISRRFVNCRDRLEGKRSLSITTPVERGRMPFLLDLLASEEIYLLDAFDVPARVNVSAENMTLQHIQDTPENISLKMELAEPDRFYGQIIGAATAAASRQGVFSEQFAEQFS